MRSADQSDRFARIAMEILAKGRRFLRSESHWARLLRYIVGAPVNYKWPLLPITILQACGFYLTRTVKSHRCVAIRLVV